MIPPMPVPRPYSIDVADSVLDDLRARLARTRWPEPLADAGWDYGANVGYIRELCAYWANGYDWRAQEARLNGRPGFLLEVDGVDLHFWHVRGEREGAFPLLLIHGWPGSMVEFEALIGPLTEPSKHGGRAEDAFDVVIPALPGFGFGGKPTERGWGIARIAAAFDTLMGELGYGRYGVQGGDWGGITAAKMGSAHADHVAGIHLNFVVAPPPAEMTDADRAAAAERALFQAQETGYSNVQGTKPDSLTVAQSDSPAGLAAWIVEKFRAWSDCDGDVESAIDRDRLLTNLMFYWAPNSIASAARIYYEASHDPASFRYPKVEVPTGVAVFPKEPWRVPRSWAEARFNVTRWTEMARGGHFAAMEAPELLVDDVRAFFATVR
jgi:microsomal epoxide hydrolase